MSNQEIILDLNQQLSSINIKDSTNNLQIKAEKRIDTLFNQFIKLKKVGRNYNELIKDEIDHSNRSNVIFIQGGRGAGKTTFVKYILNKYLNAESKNIFPIAFIDPTLIESHQKILTIIITRLNEIVSEKFDKCRKDARQDEWESILSKLSQGLNLLSSENSKAHDNSWFMYKAMNDVKSALDLERYFYKLIENSINILGKDLLVLAIDDIDTKAKIAYEVLEIIRCYFSHPKLVVLISGDLELYSHIIQKNKIKEVSLDDLDKNNNSNKKQMLIHLEQQYLSKVLPVENRIQLQNIPEIISSNNKIVIMHESLNQIDNLKEDKSIQNVLYKIFTDTLCIDKKYLTTYVNFILNQPTRTVIQFIKSLADHLSENEIDFTNSTKQLKDVVRNIFISDLVNEDLNLDNLESDTITETTVGYEIFKLLERHNDLETGFYCRPDSSIDKNSYNSAKLYLSSIVTDLMNKNEDSNKKFSRMLRLILSCGGSANIYMNNVLSQGNNLKQEYMNYIGLDKNEKIYSLTEHFSPIILDGLLSKVISSGVIRTTRRKTGDFDKNQHISLEKLAGLLQSANDTDRILCTSILMSSSHSIANAEKRDYISIYNLLASISELLNINIKDNSKKMTEDMIEDMVSKLSDLRTYGYPYFITGNKVTNVEDDGNNEDDSDESSDNNLMSNNIYDLIYSWLVNIESLYDQQKELNTSLLCIGKIWTRIYYSLTSISENMRRKNPSTKKDYYLGEVFSTFIWGVVNSVLIEEYRYRKSDNKHNLLSTAKNVLTSDVELFRNIQKIIPNSNKDNIEKFKQSLPLTYCLMTCPLIYVFLNEEILNLIGHPKLYMQKDVIESKISSLQIMGSFKK